MWRLIRRLSPHSLRHTAITHLLDDGAALHEAQDFADPRTTQIYNHNRQNLDGHGSYRLAAWFSRKTG